MGRPDCHDKTTIDKWISDLDVQVWNMNKVINFGAYGPDPTYYVNKLFNSMILDPNRIISNYMFITKNIFNNVDSYWPGSP
jgi:hypothetical protein